MSLMKFLCGVFSRACGCEPSPLEREPKTAASSAATDAQPNMADRPQTTPPDPVESAEIPTPS